VKHFFLSNITFSKSVFLMLLFTLLVSTSCEIDYTSSITHRISGVIVDPSGNPIQGAKVTVRGQSANDEFVTYTTDVSGGFDGYIAGVHQDINQLYLLEIEFRNETIWLTKNYYFSMKDQPNFTLNLNQITIYPTQDFKEIQVGFNFTNQNLAIESFHWFGQLAWAEGNFFYYNFYNPFSFYNLAPPNSQSVISYELIDYNTGQKTSFTRTIEVLEENVNLVINH
jgi:hypothetical protein